MYRKDLNHKIRKDLSPLLSIVKGVYLFGSQADGKADERSDIDICLVAGEYNDPEKLQFSAWKWVATDKYDIRIFELLPLYMQMQVIYGGILVYAQDNADLGEYLYPYRKRWDDQRWYQNPIPGAP